MTKVSFIEKIKNGVNELSGREKKGLIFMLCVIVIVFCLSIIPKIFGNVKDKILDQNERLNKAQKAIGQSERIVGKYTILKMRQAEIEKNFEKNDFKEGHFSYCDSLKSSDMTQFAIGTQQTKDFGKDFTQTTFKINFKAPSLSTVINFIKKLESDQRKYLISELNIRKAYNELAVTLEVNSIEKKKVEAK